MDTPETKYITRITRLTISPETEPIFSEQATHVEIDDDAAGEYVVIKQQRGDTRDDYREAVLIDEREWGPIKGAVDQMIGYLKK